MRLSIFGASSLVLVGLLASPALGQEVVREEVEGIRNFARVGTTIACAGAITTTAIPEIEEMGFASIINLRRATEEGANVEAEAAAVAATGMKYFHIPYDGSADPAVAAQFLDAITSEGAEPAFVHCAGGGRAAAMWLVKRIAVDHWDVERATEEAIALGGEGNPERREFAIAYGQANRR
ncbi:MAG: sulfur transferase domain-containing protein [Acidobacteria bacterium]|nr:sulfur transferase domain-containing protein [Acidobacteriota bacterium]